jgi:GNAT superfamily N-acetyltransferase
MTVKHYLLTVPERVVRAVLGLGAGVAREVGEVGLPEGIRKSRLYQNVVDATLRFLIEQVGGAEGVYRDEENLPENFLARRTAGNAVEALGLVAFRASPVWVLAALADLCGMGRHLIPEISDALKTQGLLDKDAEFGSVDQLLDGLERTSARLASTINAPPLDVAGLRQEWDAIRRDAAALPSVSLPSREAVGAMWADLKAEAERQDRSIFETSSMMAVSAARAIPDGVRWIAASTRVGATRTTHMLASALLDHYSQTLSEIRRVGYMTYAAQQFRPYVRAAARQFSPARRTLTQRLLDRWGSTGGYQIRQATPADAAAIAEAHIDSIRSIGPVFYPLNVVSDWGEGLSPALYARAMEDGEAFFIATGSIDGAPTVLGFATHRVDGTRHGTSVYVRGSAARRGIGTALLRSAEAHAIASGAATVHIEASLAGEKFYRENGYEEVSRGETTLMSGRPIACIFMQKTLTPASANRS